MQRNRRPRKLLTVPGLLVLALLPLVMMHAVSSHHSLQKQYVMEVNTMTYELLADTSWWTIKLPQRNYQPVEMDGKLDEEKLEEVRLLVKKMLAEEDTLNGVKLHFARGSKYKHFIEAIDICKSEGLKTFAPVEDDFYMMYFPIRPPKPDTSRQFIAFCGTRDFEHYEMSKEYRIERENTIEEERKEARKQTESKLIIPLALLACIGGISTYRIYKRE